jgi:hypothetical protein
MKAFEFPFGEGFLKGLRRYENTPRNEETLIECYNWAPQEKGLEVHEVIIYIGEE